MADTVETAIYRLRVEGQDQLDRLTKSIEGLAVAEEDATKATRTTSDELQKRVARYDPLLRAQQAYSKELQNIARYQETGVGTQQEINALFEGATARYQSATKATQQLGEAHQGMSTQAQSAYHSMRSFFEQIAMGASPMQAATAQMNHLAYAASGEGGIGGAFKQAAEMATSFLTPVRVAIGAVAALAAGVGYLASQWSAAQKEARLATAGIGGASGTSVGDINRFAQRESSYGGLTTGEARNAAMELAKTGQIAIATLHGVGDAIHGFAALTNTDATAATKTLAQALSGDLVKGMDDLNKVTGDFSAKDREFIQGLQAAGKETEARQFMIDKMSDSLRKAAAETGFWSDQWDRFKQAVSSAGENLGKAISGGDLEQQLARTKAALDELEKSPGKNAFAAEMIETLKQKVAELNAELEKQNAANYAKQMNILGTEAQAVTEKLVPQIAALREAQNELAKLQAAREAGQGNDLTDVLTNKLRAYIEQLKQATTATGLLATETANTSAKNVAALGDAATAAEKAQAKIDALNAAFANGVITSDTYARAIQAVNAALAASVPVTQAMIAAQNTLGDLMRANLTIPQIAQPSIAQYPIGSARELSGITREIAGNTGTTANNVKITGDITQYAVGTSRVLYDNTDKTAASSQRAANSAEDAAESQRRTAIAAKQQAEEQRRSAESARAQQQAIEAANRSQAEFAAATKQAADEYDRMAAASVAATKANNALHGGGGGTFTPDPTLTWKTGASILSPAGQVLQQQLNLQNATAQNITNFSDQVSLLVGSGGIGGALAFTQAQQAHPQISGAPPIIPGYGQVSWADWGQSAPTLSQALSESAIISQVGSLYTLMNQQTTDKAAQAKNLQAEMAWLQSRPQSLEQQQAIVSLKQSIDQLTNSTDSLNATNKELLSPYYTQDPRTSHIGFRSQGMALGGYVDVPGGVSSNDNMIATIPVASGERIYIDPMNNRRGTGGSGGGMTINISSPVLIQGNANKDDVGRTMFQNNQALAKQIGAATAR